MLILNKVIKMMTSSRYIAILTIIPLICGLKSFAQQANTEEIIAQGPMFMGSPPIPNVMFTLDDSRSMFWEFMPDELYGTRADGRWATSVFALHDYYASNNANNWGYAVLIDDNRRFIFKSRFNTIYYNPDTTYTPWSRPDGTIMPNSSPSCALHFPDLSKSGIPGLTYQSGVKGAGRTVRVTDTASCVGGRDFTRSLPGRSDPASYTIWTRADLPSNVSNRPNHYLNPHNWTEVFINPTQRYKNKRTECQPNGCDFNQEIQNYANWYTYYRSRMLTARAGAGRAFSTAANMRLGFATINKGSSGVDGKNTSKVVSGVRKFTGADKAEWFKQLYTDVWMGGTPLRSAVDSVGRYFQRDDARSPWAENNHLPSGQPSQEHSSCRANYHILMTDGYWNGDNHIHVGNQDENMGKPFADQYSNSLADVVAKYWKTDLRQDLVNNVPTSAKNPANWQHLVHYSVGLGVAPSVVDETQVFQNILTDTAPNPAWPSALHHQIDDLVHAAVNGRGAYFSATNPDEFATALSDILQQIQSQSVPGRMSRSQIRLDRAGLPSYIASYSSSPSWHGDIKAYTTDPVTGELSKTPLWRAAAKLATKPAASRHIFTSEESRFLSGVNLNSVSASWKSDLMGGSSVQQQNDMINYIRGDHSKELVNGGVFRTRKDSEGQFTKLGDIVNSRVIIDNRQDFGWGSFPVIPHNEQSDYTKYLRSKRDPKQRQPVLFVGANDGMLHAFSGVGDSSGGEELFAYIPKMLRFSLKHLTDPNIEHRYYMDGTPVLRDARIGRGDEWRTVLLAAPAAGAAGIFALDVTEASQGEFDSAHVLWDVGDSYSEPQATALSALANRLGKDQDVRIGHIMGNAEVAYVDKRWVAIYGNGWAKPSIKENGKDKVGGYRVPTLIIADLKTGDIVHALTPYCANGVDGYDGYGGKLKQGVSNGLSTPTVITNTQKTTVLAIYAGDYAGNLWRFDLSGSPSSWKNNKCNSSGQPQIHKIAHVTGDGRTSATLQPIAVAPVVTKHPMGGEMVFFGTGRLMLLKDDANTDTQAFYAVRDTQALRDAGHVATVANLHRVSISDEVMGGKARVITSQPFVWSDAKRGWYLNLQHSTAQGNGNRGERVLYPADVTAGQLLFTTSELSSHCGVGVVNRLYVLDALTGGASRILPQASLNKYGLSSSGHKNCTVGRCGSFVMSGDAQANPLDIVLASHNSSDVAENDKNAILGLACPAGTRPRMAHGMVVSCMVEGLSGFYQIQ